METLIPTEQLEVLNSNDQHETQALQFLHAAFLNVTHFRVGLRLFVGDAESPTVELWLEDSFLSWALSSLVGLLASALVVSVAILPPSFSHRSSIFFFRRFLATGSAIVVASLLVHSLQINAPCESASDISRNQC